MKKLIILLSITFVGIGNIIGQVVVLPGQNRWISPAEIYTYVNTEVTLQMYKDNFGLYYDPTKPLNNPEIYTTLQKSEDGNTWIDCRNPTDYTGYDDISGSGRTDGIKEYVLTKRSEPGLMFYRLKIQHMKPGIWPTPATIYSTAYSTVIKVNYLHSINAGEIECDSKTICFNSSPTIVKNKSIDVIQGTTSVFWESSEDGINWQLISGANDIAYQPGPLIKTTLYRRGIKTVLETKYTNPITITVLPKLTIANATSSHSICYNTAPTELNGGIVQGGDGVYTYQWQISDNEIDWKDIILYANGASYQPGYLEKTTYFRRKTFALCGENNIGSTIAVQVRPPLAVSNASINQIVCYATAPSILTGGTASGGSGSYGYQWEVSADGVTWGTISGATSQNYQPGALTATAHYRRKVTDASCGHTYSNVIKIDVRPELTAGIASNAATCCYGSAPSSIDCTAPTGGSGSYTYQWESGTNVNAMSQIAGATSNNYQPGALTATTLYRKKVTDQSCGSVYTNVVQRTVWPEMSGGTISGSITICNNTVPLILTGGTASGGSGSYSYQWEVSTNGTSWNTIVGATSQNYQPGALTVSTYFRRIATDASCGQKTSNIVMVTVRQALAPGNVTGTQTICYNSIPIEIAGSIATGGSGAYSYQWESSANGVTWNTITGATSQNYQPGALTATAHYRRKTVDQNCETGYSNGIIITVSGNLSAGNITNAQTICSNTTPSPIAGGAPTGGSGSYSYQWESSANGVTWNTIVGATSQNYQPGALTATTHYRRMVTSASCGSAYSNTVVIEVRPILNAGTIGSEQTICYNTAPSTLTGGTASGGSGSYSYQWERSTNGASWNTIVGATSQNYQPGALTANTLYRRVDSDVCASKATNTVTVNVQPQVVAGSITGTQTVCYNTAASLQAGNAPTGGSGTYTYQWQYSNDGAIWADIETATMEDYQSNNLVIKTHYRRKTVNECGNAISNVATVSIHQQLNAGTIGTSETVVYNTAPSVISVSEAPSGGGGSYTYQWQRSTDGVVWTNVPGATSESYQPAAITLTTHYRRITISATCGSAFSNVVTKSCYGQMDGGTIGDNQTKCYNTSVSALTTKIPATGGTGSYSYQWESSSDGTSWNEIVGYTSESYQPGAATAKKYYRRKATSPGGGSAYSNVAIIDVFPDLVAAVIGSDQTICYNTTPEPLQITTSPSGGDGSYTYQWQQSSNGTSWTNITGATGIYLEQAPLSAKMYFRQNTINTCKIKQSNVVAINVSDVFAPGSIGSDQTILYNTAPQKISVAVPASGGDGSYTYQWQQSLNGTSWLNISGATTDSYQPGALTQKTYFRRQTTNALCGTLPTNPVAIAITTDIAVGTIGHAQTICSGTKPDKLVTLTNPSSQAGVYYTQWQQSADGAEWANIPGATESEYSPGAMAQSMYYRKIVSTGSIGDVATNIIKITVGSTFSPGTIKDNQDVCSNSTASPIVFDVNPSGSDGSYTYQWQKSTNNAEWADIANATGAFYNPIANTTKTYYRANVSGACGTVATNSVYVAMNDAVLAGTIGEAQTISYNGVPAKLVGDMPSGGSGIYTYQWQHSTDGNTWSNLAGATTDSYQPGALSRTTSYRRIAMSVGCSNAISNIVEVTVSPNLLPGSIGSAQTVCYNAVPNRIEGTAANGGNGIYAYQWQQSVDGIAWTDIFGKSGIDYQPGRITQPTQFRRKVTSGTDVKYSNAVLVEHLEQVANPTLTPNAFYCKNSTVQLALATDYSVIWYNSDMGELSTSKTISFTANQPTSIYYSVRNEIGCLSVPQKVAINVDYADSHIKTNEWDNSSVVNGKRVTFLPDIESNHASGNLTYQWDFTHKTKGLYVTMYDEKPSQYFHWEGWYDATLKVKTPNGCQYEQKVENFFNVLPEEPNTDKSGTADPNEPIGEKRVELEVSMYPVPVSDYLNMKFNKNVTLEVEILSSRGESITRAKVIDGNYLEIPVGHLASGIYFVRAYNADGIVYFQDKFTKTK